MGAIKARDDVEAERVVRERNEATVVQRTGKLSVLAEREHAEMILVDASNDLGGLRAIRGQLAHHSMNRAEPREGLRCAHEQHSDSHPR